jgi:hypothetical protein
MMAEQKMRRIYLFKAGQCRCDYAKDSVFTREVTWDNPKEVAGLFFHLQTKATCGACYTTVDVGNIFNGLDAVNALASKIEIIHVQPVDLDVLEDIYDLIEVKDGPLNHTALLKMGAEAKLRYYHPNKPIIIIPVYSI